MNPVYRPAELVDVPAAAEVFLAGLAELAKSHGLPAPAYTRASVEPLYEHLLENGIFELAELDGKVVAIAAGVVRDEIAFLSMFWVLPELKAEGLGRPLLERFRSLAAARGGVKYCTWSSIDFTAVAMYLKAGMLPRGPIFTFMGPLLRSPLVDPALTLSELDASHASGIDHIVRGTPRAVDHAFWRARGTPAFHVESSGHTIGYFYAENGAIGPAAWLRAEDGPRLLASALAQAASQAENVKLIALGLNHTALEAALDAGLRLVSASHFLCSEPFGKLDQYVPSGPGLF